MRPLTADPLAGNAQACANAVTERIAEAQMDRPISKRTVIVNDKMQKGYRYRITEPAGRNFDREFRPGLTPKEMLALGVFCGKYMTDCGKDSPPVGSHKHGSRPPVATAP